jgi:2-methylcitrate dehydratase PrpD
LSTREYIVGLVGMEAQVGIAWRQKGWNLIAMNSIDMIAAWASGLTLSQIPCPVTDLVKRAFLDTISVSLSGAQLDSARIVARLATDRTGARESSVIGQARKACVLDAALINGTSAHAELFDDNNEPMISHPSAPLVSALLPLGQARGKSGADVLLAYVVGFEVGVTLGRQLNPQLYEAGWHVTRILGNLGATAACSRLLGLDAKRTGAALGIAASMSSGLRQNFGTMTMALHVGLTARDAVHATLLAECGFGADADALDGKYGFFELFGGRKPHALPLGAPFELEASGIIFKPYPSGAPTHAAVDAALALGQAIGGAAERIRKIRCLVHPWNFMTLREGKPKDTLRARVSLRYCVAAALRYGALGSAQFTDACLVDPAVERLMDLVEIEAASDLPNNGIFPAEVHIVLDDNSKLGERREVPPGAPQRPFSQEQADQKFRNCAQGVLSEGQMSPVSAMIATLDKLPAIATLCEALEGQI